MVTWKVRCAGWKGGQWRWHRRGKFSVGATVGQLELAFQPSPLAVAFHLISVTGVRKCFQLWMSCLSVGCPKISGKHVISGCHVVFFGMWCLAKLRKQGKEPIHQKVYYGAVWLCQDRYISFIEKQKIKRYKV